MTVDVDLRDALARLALFADFEEREFDTLLAVAEEVDIPEGARVVERGQEDVGLYVIVEGEVGVVFEDAELAVLHARHLLRRDLVPARASPPSPTSSPARRSAAS